MSAKAPTVLHCAADWGLPSERFVVELVRAMTRTRPVVACGTRHPIADPFDGPVYPLQRVVSRLPYPRQAAAIRMLLAGIALRHRCAILHAHFGYWAAHAAAVARRRQRPWVLSLHGYDLLVMAATDPELTAIQTADRVIVPSRFLADAAIARGFPADRLRVIPSGVDVDAIRYAERRPAANGTVTVTFAGRFVAKKGVLEAAAAMAAASATRPWLRARFVGFGPLAGALTSELRRLSLPADVIDGQVPGAIEAALDETQLLVTPSRTAEDGDAESLGLVNLEAQAAGVPVLTTRHGGIPEAVAAAGAVLVDEDDAVGLARALGDLADDPQRWPAMGRAGREHVVARFRRSDRVADVERLYEELLSDR